jgi:hypothetical protein
MVLIGLAIAPTAIALGAGNKEYWGRSQHLNITRSL